MEGELGSWRGRGAQELSQSGEKGEERAWRVGLWTGGWQTQSRSKGEGEVREQRGDDFLEESEKGLPVPRVKAFCSSCKVK